MGWFYPYGATRRQVIDELTEERKKDGRVFRTLRKCLRGNTMYALHESGPEDDTTKWIGVYLLARHGGAWGYKDMDETVHPYYYDCPVSYLDEADEATTDGAKEWRRIVREKAAERAAKKPKVGETWSLEGCLIKEVKIVSLRPLHGVADGTRYRIKRSRLGKKIDVSIQQEAN